MLGSGGDMVCWRQSLALSLQGSQSSRVDRLSVTGQRVQSWVKESQAEWSGLGWEAEKPGRASEGACSRFGVSGKAAWRRGGVTWHLMKSGQGLGR